jgi:cardiolipin synthase
MAHWDTEEVFQDGDSFFARLETEILHAKDAIDFECYIFRHDELGRKILSALREAKKRGVRVRLLVDGIGSAHWSYHFLSSLWQEGIEAKIYHPLPWSNRKSLTGLKFYRYFRLRALIKSLWKLNRRNHRKVCIIDRRIAYLGGMNVSSLYIRKYAGVNTWRDTSVRVSGAEVSKLLEAFHSAWVEKKKRKIRERTWFKKQTDYKSSLVKLNDTLRRRHRYHQEIIQRILTAKKRVWITTPYFVPELSFIRALRFAVWSGVDVRILLPRKNDLLFMSWANRSFYALLLKIGARIYEYVPAVLHAKVVLIDDWVTIGSTNRNHRSLIHDLEVDIVLTHFASKQSVEKSFLTDIEKSQEVTLATWERQPKWRLFFERLILYFRYWV